MKVLMINGSPRVNGNTSIALKEMEKIFAEEGVESETIQIGNKDIRGCIACGTCAAKGSCVFDDPVNEIATKFREADGLVVTNRTAGRTVTDDESVLTATRRRLAHGTIKTYLEQMALLGFTRAEAAELLQTWEEEDT